MDHNSRGNYRGGFRGRGNGRGRGNHFNSGHSDNHISNHGRYHQRGRGRGSRNFNSHGNSGYHAKSFEEILEAMTQDPQEETLEQSSQSLTGLDATKKPPFQKRERSDDLDEDIAQKYRALIKLDTPDDIAKWIESRKKNYPTNANIDKKKKRQNGEGHTAEFCQAPPNKKNSIGLDYSGSDSEPEVIAASATKEAGKTSEVNVVQELKESVVPTAPLSFPQKRKICSFYQNGNCSRGKKCTLMHSGPQASKLTKYHKHNHLFTKLQETEAKNNAPILLQAIRLFNLFLMSNEKQ